jgi:hypothetical protein
MQIYLDMCCLKRPFDDQSQARVHLESEAVLALLAAAPERVQFVRAAALDVENDCNTVPTRAAKVRQWLAALPLASLSEANLGQRAKELMSLGFRNFDALHIGSAELAGADFFASCDDRLLAAAKRCAAELKVGVMNPVELAKEVFL